jgi:glycosyltransferase involved in cell wall biosynthesis
VRFIRNAQRPASTAYRQPPAPDKLRFGFISNNVLDRRKGFEQLPPFLQGLTRHGISVAIHVYGHIPRGRSLRIPSVEIIAGGTFARERLNEVYDSFDILLCPSRHDNSPNVVTEALAYGRPVIAQAGTGIDSYLTSDTGASVDFFNDNHPAIDNFVYACKRIAANYLHYSTAAATYAADFLHPAIIGHQYLQLYSELIENRRGSPESSHRRALIV